MSSYPPGIPKRSTGIDWPSAKALLHAFLVMDFRNQAFGRATNTGAKDIFSPLYWVTGQNLLISCFVAGVLFARVEAFAFAFACLAISMVVCVTSVIVEFNEIVLSPDDLPAIGHQPVSVKTYAAARMANLLLYILYVILTLNVVPAILGIGLLETTVWFGFVYVLATMVGSFLVAGCMILFYVTFFGGRPSQRVQETLAWTQAGLMLLTGYGGQAVLRDSRDQLEMAIYHWPTWIQWTPPGWLANFVVSSNGGLASIQWWILASGAGVSVLVWFFVYRNLAHAYGKLQTTTRSMVRETASALPAPGSLVGNGLTNRWLGRSSDERAAYWFCRTMLRRDHNFRMRIWPTFGIPVAFLSIGVFTGELVDPLIARGEAVAITLTAIYSLVLPLPTIFFSMRFSKDYDAGWMFSVAPIEDPAAFARGLEKAILLWVMVPFLLVVAIVLSLMWNNAIHVGMHLVAVCLVVLMSAKVSSGLIFRKIPFSQPLGRGEMLGPIVPLIAVIGSLAMTLGGLHYLATWDVVWFAGYLMFLGVLTVVAHSYARHMIRRRCQLGWAQDAN